MIARSLTVCSCGGEPVVPGVQMDKTSCRTDEVYPGKVMDKQSLKRYKKHPSCAAFCGEYMDNIMIYHDI